MKRVVITGVGAITPIGNNKDEFWASIKEGKCGAFPQELLKYFDYIIE